MVLADFESLEKDEALSAEVAAVCLLRTFMELVHQKALVECAGYLAVLHGRGFRECLLAEVRADPRSTIKTQALRQLVQRALARCGPASVATSIAASRRRKVKQTLGNKGPNLLVASRLAVALHMNQLAPLLGRNAFCAARNFPLAAP